MSEQRADLAEVIRANVKYSYLGQRVVDASELAEGILAVGYRKPRVIATHGELSDQPNGIIVRSSAGTVASIEHGNVYVFGIEDRFTVKMLGLPCTVLWEPSND